ncbi:MAG: transporter substrate-binding domain-containing protein [Hyphomicrobiales bacterium]
MELVVNAYRSDLKAFIGLVLTALLLALLALPALALEPGSIPNFWDPKRRLEAPATTGRPSIRFLTTDDFPPFNFIDSTGQLTGFNADLARAVCVVIGLPCTIQARPFAELLPALEKGDGDAVIAGLSQSAVNRDRVDFSETYLRLPARFAVRKEDLRHEATPEGLAGRIVAVAAGTAHEAYLTAFFPKMRLRPYPTIAEARAALKSGEAEVLFGDGLSTSFWLGGKEADGCCTMLGGAYTEIAYFGEGLAIAVRHGDTTLRAMLDYGLQQVYQNGTYAELYMRYFPVGIY